MSVMNEEKKISLQELFNNIPEEESIFQEVSLNIALSIQYLLERNNKTQKDLASKLSNVSEPLLSKWLKGGHNYTLKTLIKIEKGLKDLGIDEKLFFINKDIFYNDTLRQKNP